MHTNRRISRGMKVRHCWTAEGGSLGLRRRTTETHWKGDGDSTQIARDCATAAVCIQDIFHFWETLLRLKARAARSLLHINLLSFNKKKKSGCPWRSMFERFGNSFWSAHACTNSYIRAEQSVHTCLFVTRLPKFNIVAQDIYMQFIFTSSTFISLNFVLTSPCRLTPPSVYTF